MSGSRSVGQDVHRRRPRILVVQSGIERGETLDLLHDLAPESVETVNDVYEAVAHVGLATARDHVDTVVVPITIPDFSAARIVEAFDLCDRQVRLVLLAPNGRVDAMRNALDAGFDDAVEMPATLSRLERAIGLSNGIVPSRTVEIERAPHPLDPLDRHDAEPRSRQPRPAAREVLARATREPEDTPPAENQRRDRDEDPAAARSGTRTGSGPGHEPDSGPPNERRAEDGDRAEAPPASEGMKPSEQLGDVDLVTEILSEEGNLRSTSLAMIRTHLGTQDIHLLLAEETFAEDGRATATVVHGEVHLGTLVSSTVGSDALRDWANWLAVWMGLERHVRGLKRLTETDELTGAGNRRAFERVLKETLAAAGNERRLVTLMVFDIDNFKTYNDRYGHDAGDQVLRETVDLLRSTIRRGDHVFRIGGDEFVVIFSDAEGPRTERSAPPESVEAIAYRFQAKVCELRFPQLGLDADGSLSISAGLATFPWDGLDGNTLLRRADQLAMESKRSGKNALRFGPGARSRCHRSEADDDQA